MSKYIFLQNIVSPYRVSFFNELNETSFDFEVLYMSKTESGRDWDVPEDSIKFNYYIDQGFYKQILRFHIHFNYKLLLRIILSSDKDVILGGSWNDLNVIALVLLKKYGILRNRLHFWSEANNLTIGSINDNYFKAILRRFIFNSADGFFIIPGRMSAITFTHWGIINKKFVNLPNTISEELFVITHDDLFLRSKNILPVFIIPARLHEQSKGIINFFNSIGKENTLKGIFLIPGSGPDKKAISDFIKSENLTQNIQLLGFRPLNEMVKIYKQANIFILPSFSDPSPLSLVEALSMHLPLLVSERCGNHYEAVVTGENGYLFNPSKPNTIKDAFEDLLYRRLDWQTMGEKSFHLYKQIFKKDMVVNNFIKSMNS